MARTKGDIAVRTLEDSMDAAVDRYDDRGVIVQCLLIAARRGRQIREARHKSMVENAETAIHHAHSECIDSKSPLSEPIAVSSTNALATGR